MQDINKVFLEKLERHKGVVFKISKMYMDNIDDQNDLFQEIVYQAWKSFANFEGKSEFSTWLYRVAINTAMVFLKREKQRNLDAYSNIETLPLKHDAYDDEVDTQLQLMYQCIQQLNPVDKALIFYFLEDFSGRDIALQMGVSEVNVRVKLNRAKTKLKELIDKNKTK